MSGLRNTSSFNPVNKEKVFAEYEKKLDQAVSDYSDRYAIVLKNHEQKMAEKERQKAFKISEFDTYPPSGKLIDVGLFSSYQTHKEDGKVRLENGDYGVYNIIYTPSGEFDCYRLHYSTVGLSSRDYKSFDEMVYDLSIASLNSK